MTFFRASEDFSLGLERTGGFETVAFCEIEPYCRVVLAKHWPSVKQYDDVRTLTADTLRSDGITVDVICGGFPCTDISVAGKGLGITGPQSVLWREYARIIGELRPQFVIVENVAALLGRGLADVLRDLAAFGYDAEWHCIPASAVGAPHRRDRVWIIAYPNGAGLAFWESISRDISQEQPPAVGTDWWIAESGVDRVANGISNRVDRITALGNAVVPQIPELLGRAILEAEGLTP